LCRAFDAFFLDVILPGMSALDMARRSSELRVQTRIVMLTVRDAVDDVIRGLDCAGGNYVTKLMLVQAER
jgi:two-component system OmpR family response regulator